MVPDDPKDAVLEALWGRVLEAWDEDRAHAALLEYALRSQELPEVASRYRALLDDPQKGPLAKKKLDAIVTSATSMLWSTKTPTVGKVPLPITLSAFGVSFALLAWLVWTVWGKH